MDKIKNLKNIDSILPSLKNSSVVLTGGCFDLLHEGHAYFLDEAKKMGDILIVLLESDESVRKKKGETRPINKQEIRAQALNINPNINYIILLPALLTDQEYFELVKTIKPAIIALTEGDSLEKIKKAQAESVGGETKIVKRKDGFSTTNLLKQN